MSTTLGMINTVQLIDFDGNFIYQEDHFNDLINTYQISATSNNHYTLMAIIGSQATGKSTLFNALFPQTHFPTMDSRKGRQQTTQGIWLSLAPTIVSNHFSDSSPLSFKNEPHHYQIQPLQIPTKNQHYIALLDIEGFDSVERKLQEQRQAQQYAQRHPKHQNNKIQHIASNLSDSQNISDPINNHDTHIINYIPITTQSRRLSILSQSPQDNVLESSVLQSSVHQSFSQIYTSSASSSTSYFHNFHSSAPSSPPTITSCNFSSSPPQSLPHVVRTRSTSSSSRSSSHLTSTNNTSPISTTSTQNNNPNEIADDDGALFQFEHSASLFALSLCNILIINLFENDIGRHSTSPTVMLERVIENSFLLFEPTTRQKMTLLFVIRDFDDVLSNMELRWDIIMQRIDQEIHQIWENIYFNLLSDPLLDLKNAFLTFDDFFIVKFVPLPHFHYRFTEFANTITLLQHTLFSTPKSTSSSLSLFPLNSSSLSLLSSLSSLSSLSASPFFNFPISLSKNETLSNAASLFTQYSPPSPDNTSTNLSQSTSFSTPFPQNTKNNTKTINTQEHHHTPVNSPVHLYQLYEYMSNIWDIIFQYRNTHQPHPSDLITHYKLDNYVHKIYPLEYKSNPNLENLYNIAQNELVFDLGNQCQFFLQCTNNNFEKYWQDQEQIYQRSMYNQSIYFSFRIIQHYRLIIEQMTIKSISNLISYQIFYFILKPLIVEFDQELTQDFRVTKKQTILDETLQDLTILLQTDITKSNVKDIICSEYNICERFSSLCLSISPFIEKFRETCNSILISLNYYEEYSKPFQKQLILICIIKLELYAIDMIKNELLSFILTRLVKLYQPVIDEYLSLSCIEFEQPSPNAVIIPPLLCNPLFWQKFTTLYDLIGYLGGSWIEKTLLEYSCSLTAMGAEYGYNSSFPIHKDSFAPCWPLDNSIPSSLSLGTQSRTPSTTFPTLHSDAQIFLYHILYNNTLVITDLQIGFNQQLELNLLQQFKNKLFPHLNKVHTISLSLPVSSVPLDNNSNNSTILHSTLPVNTTLLTHPTHPTPDVATETETATDLLHNLSPLQSSIFTIFSSVFLFQLQHIDNSLETMNSLYKTTYRYVDTIMYNISVFKLRTLTSLPLIPPLCAFKSTLDCSESKNSHLQNNEDDNDDNSDDDGNDDDDGVSIIGGDNTSFQHEQNTDSISMKTFSFDTIETEIPQTMAHQAPQQYITNEKYNYTQAQLDSQPNTHLLTAIELNHLQISLFSSSKDLVEQNTKQLREKIETKTQNQHIQQQRNVILRISLSILRTVPFYSYMQKYPYITLAMCGIIGKRFLTNLFVLFVNIFVHFHVDFRKLFFILIAFCILYYVQYQKEQQRLYLLREPTPFRASAVYKEFYGCLSSSSGSSHQNRAFGTPLRSTQSTQSTIPNYTPQTGGSRNRTPSFAIKNGNQNNLTLVSEINTQLTRNNDNPDPHVIYTLDFQENNSAGYVNTSNAGNELGYLANDNNTRHHNTCHFDQAAQYFEDLVELSYQSTVATLEQVSLESLIDAANRAAEVQEEIMAPLSPSHHRHHHHHHHRPDDKYPQLTLQLKQHREEQQKRFYKNQMSVALAALQKADFFSPVTPASTNTTSSVAKKTPYNNNSPNIAPSHILTSPLTKNNSSNILLSTPHCPHFSDSSTPSLQSSNLQQTVSLPLTNQFQFQQKLPNTLTHQNVHQDAHFNSSNASISTIDPYHKILENDHGEDIVSEITTNHLKIEENQGNIVKSGLLLSSTPKNHQNCNSDMTNSFRPQDSSQISTHSIGNNTRPTSSEYKSRSTQLPSRRFSANYTLDDGNDSTHDLTEQYLSLPIDPNSILQQSVHIFSHPQSNPNNTNIHTSSAPTTPNYNSSALPTADIDLDQTLHSNHVTFDTTNMKPISISMSITEQYNSIPLELDNFFKNHQDLIPAATAPSEQSIVATHLHDQLQTLSPVYHNTNPVSPQRNNIPFTLQLDPNSDSDSELDKKDFTTINFAKNTNTQTNVSEVHKLSNSNSFSRRQMFQSYTTSHADEVQRSGSRLFIDNSDDDI